MNISFTPRGTDLIVSCKDCGKKLDVVPDRHTALLRAGVYAEHKCPK